MVVVRSLWLGPFEPRACARGGGGTGGRPDGALGRARGPRARDRGVRSGARPGPGDGGGHGVDRSEPELLGPYLHATRARTGAHGGARALCLRDCVPASGEGLVHRRAGRSAAHPAGAPRPQRDAPVGGAPEGGEGTSRPGRWGMLWNIPEAGDQQESAGTRRLAVAGTIERRQRTVL